MMDRDSVRSQRNDNGGEIALEVTSTGNSSEVLPTGADEVGEGSRMINSTSSKDAGLQSLLTPGEQRSDDLEGGGQRNSSGRQNSKSRKAKRESGKGKKDGFGEKRNAMMVVSVLIATLTYQATLNPPGGFWQDDQNGNSIAPTGDIGFYRFWGLRVHEPGTAINSGTYGFQLFLAANTVALFSSLVIILLLTSAITIRRQILMWLLMFIMWVSVFAVAFTFCMGTYMILKKFEDVTSTYLKVGLLCCVVLFALLVILHVGVGLRKLYRRVKRKRSHGEEVGRSASQSLPR